MARHGLLLSVKWLKNHGLVVKRADGEQEFVRPDGTVRISVAAMALGSSDMMVYRLIRSGGLRVLRAAGGITTVRLGELRAVRRRWRELGKKTIHFKAAS